MAPFLLFEEYRGDNIRERVEEMRKGRKMLTEKERLRIKERLDSEEGREYVKNVLSFYQESLSARARSEYDPLLKEWMVQVEDITR